MLEHGESFADQARASRQIQVQALRVANWLGARQPISKTFGDAILGAESRVVAGVRGIGFSDQVRAREERDLTEER